MSPRYALITDDAAFDDVLAQLHEAPSYGVDTEFHRERTYYPQLALVQLAWREGERTQVVLVDPFSVDVRALRPVLEGPGLALLHAAEQDLLILERECGALPTRLFDVQLASAFLGKGTPSLGNLVQEVLGRELSKSAQLADWTRRPLERALLDYAASDVAHLHDLHEALQDRLGSAGRLGWAEEENERLRRKPRGFPVPEEVWWKLKGKGKLKGGARGVAQAVGAWRERRAAERDLPPRSIMSDMALLQLAQRPPATTADLDRLRDADRRRIRRGEADAVLAAVRKGKELRGDALRLPPRPPRDLASPAAVTLAQAWVAQVARREGIDPSILATRDEVARFARGAESRLAKGWRQELAGADVAALLAGEVGLVLRDEALWLVDLP